MQSVPSLDLLNCESVTATPCMCSIEVEFGPTSEIMADTCALRVEGKAETARTSAHAAVDFPDHFLPRAESSDSVISAPASPCLNDIFVASASFNRIFEAADECLRVNTDGDVTTIYLSFTPKSNSLPPSAPPPSRFVRGGKQGWGAPGINATTGC